MTDTTNFTGIRLCDDDHSQEWHAHRKTGIGASESAAAAGLSPHTTPFEIYCRKRGELPEIDETDAMWFGSQVQPVIAAGFERETGIKVLESPLGLFRHPEHEFMLASPDALLHPNDGGEWKSTDPFYARTLGVKAGEALPAACVDWHCQAQQQMAVCGWNKVWFGVLIGRKVVPFEVERNDRLIGGLVAAERELWERIQNGDPPDLDFAHRSALGLVKDLYGEVHDTCIELSAEVSDDWLRYEDIGRQIRDLEKARKVSQVRVLQAIGDNGSGLLFDGERVVKRIAIAETEIAAYTRKAYVMMRSVKFDGKAAPPVSALAAGLQADETTVDHSGEFAKADLWLRDAGFIRYERHAGSAYYIAREGDQRVRISDHPPNEKTLEWMTRMGVVGCDVYGGGVVAELERKMPDLIHSVT